jgi:hypothetical protein
MAEIEIGVLKGLRLDRPSTIARDWRGKSPPGSTSAMSLTQA